jgi:hypothetical protein
LPVRASTALPLGVVRPARIMPVLITPDAISAPSAIGRSYTGPSFFTSAGARFTSTRPPGH